MCWLCQIYVGREYCNHRSEHSMHAAAAQLTDVYHETASVMPAIYVL